MQVLKPLNMEHGTFLDEEMVELMIEKDAILVPTLYIVEKLFKAAESSGIGKVPLEKLTGDFNQKNFNKN